MTSGIDAFTIPLINNDNACCLVGHSNVSSSK